MSDIITEPKPASPKADEWAERIAAQQRSGISVKQFCREQGLTEYSFYSWRKRLQETGPVREVQLVELTAEVIEIYLRKRLEERVQVTTSEGPVTKGLIKPSTVHQEFRVLRRKLNVAVRKKLLAANPCSGVEFPVRVKGLFRPHYVTWSEQQKIESAAPEYLRNVVRIITETGLRVYKELAR